MAITIDAGTTAPTAVLVEGNDIDANLQQIFIYEQTSAGSPTGTHSVLLGSVTTDPTGGAFGGKDAIGDDFAVVVLVSGLNSYTLGGTGAIGNIYFVGSNGNIIHAGSEAIWLSQSLLGRLRPRLSLSKRTK